jgi:transposase
VPPRATPQAVQQRAAQRVARRQARYDEVWTLHRAGWTVPAIAKQVGLSQRTIFRSLHTSTCPGQQRRSTYGRSLLTPYTDDLLTRWQAGYRTAMQLFRELQPQGYSGSYALVAAYVSRVRQAQGLPPGRRRPGQTLPSPRPRRAHAAPRHLAGAAARDTAHRDRSAATRPARLS